MEFDSVAVCDDFLSGVELSSIRDMRKCVGEARVTWGPHPFHLLLIDFAGTHVDDYNLLYVAVTRARRQLIMSNTLDCLLALAREYHFYLPPLSDHSLVIIPPPQAGVGYW